MGIWEEEGGKRRVKNDTKTFGLSTWKSGFSLFKMGKTVCVCGEGSRGEAGEDQEFYFGHRTFEIPTR